LNSKKGMAPENTYKWVQDRLRELHSGALSGDDLRQLHTLAKEDPFIADALEGFASHPEHQHDAALDRLAARIRPVKLARRRWLIPNLTVTAVAASLMIIVGFWAVMYRLQQNETAPIAETAHEVILVPEDDSAIGSISANEIVIEPTEETSISNYDAQDAAVAADEDAAAKRIAAKKNTPVQPQSKSSTREENSAMDAVAVTRPGTGTTSPPAAPATTTNSEAAIMRADEDKQEEADPMYFANQMDPSLFARRSAGRVISETGEPLIGATLNIRNTNLGTMSDLDGKFELFLPEKESKVDITFSGYEGTTVDLRQGEDDVAILLPESNLARANTKSYKTTDAPEAAGAVQQQTTYVDYLRNNSRYPLKDNLYTPGRNVTLQFDVTADGSPSRVRIKESSNDRALDEEALRLLRKGPVWACEGNKYPCAMEYTIYFR
jgi:TonB family protein